jgi:MoxR-like ATPase
MIQGARVVALLDGRSEVAAEDLRALALPSLRHRLILAAGAEDRDLTPDGAVEAVLEAVPEENAE